MLPSPPEIVPVKYTLRKRPNKENILHAFNTIFCMTYCGTLAEGLERVTFEHSSQSLLFNREVVLMLVSKTYDCGRSL